MLHLAAKSLPQHINQRTNPEKGRALKMPKRRDSLRIESGKTTLSHGMRRQSSLSRITYDSSVNADVLVK